MKKRKKIERKFETPIISMIISGGQTGVDQAALKIAKRMNIPTGGFAPKNYGTETGPNKDLKKYGLREVDSPHYPVRTKANVAKADVTILFYPGGHPSRGTKLTERLCKKMKKDHITVYNINWCSMLFLAHDLIGCWKRNERTPLIVNIAGPRESKLPGIEKKIYDFLARVFVKLGYRKERRKI